MTDGRAQPSEKEKERENMKHWIRRTFTLSALIATTAVSFAAPAQPLPVPPEAVGARAISVIQLILPESGTEMSYPNKLVWETELEPDKYVLKFKMADGATAKYNVPMEQCTLEGICSVKLGDTGVLDNAKDGDIIKWRVIATNDGEKYKSYALTFIANTVDAPELINPANGAQLDVDEDLTWDNSPANAKYTLIVRDMEGALIIKRTILSTSCAAVCSYDPFAGHVLAQQTPYQWLVKARGFNGDKVKSGKQSFTTGSWASEVMK
jgi:hypothetical protein